MTRKSTKLSLVTKPNASSTGDDPPRPLSNHGLSLWNRVMNEYDIADVGGRELLCLACEQLERVQSLRKLIDDEGEIVQTRNGLKEHPALRHELAARAFIVKTLLRLGLSVEPVRPIGRPGTGGLGWPGHE